MVEWILLGLFALLAFLCVTAFWVSRPLIGIWERQNFGCSKRKTAAGFSEKTIGELP
jgi:hypothetical protein